LYSAWNLYRDTRVLHQIKPRSGWLYLYDGVLKTKGNRPMSRRLKTIFVGIGRELPAYSGELHSPQNYALHPKPSPQRAVANYVGVQATGSQTANCFRGRQR
jgi:hypothetical protein